MRTLLIRTAFVALVVGALGACVTIPERAWVNGRAMTSSSAYQQALSGRVGFDTQRSLYSASNPLRLHSDVMWTQPKYYDR
jgi:hypothetical protein